MSVAIERDALHQAIDKLPEHRLIELAQFIEFLQFQSRRDEQAHDASHKAVDGDVEIQTQPPFNPVYFPEGILREYEFSPEFIADARKELWAGFGETVQDLFENQSPQEVEALFDAWGQRDFEDIPSDTFATLKEIEKLHSPQHIDMESEIVGDKLIFIPPQDTPLPFVVHDNEIILGDYTIRVHLKSANNVAPAQV